MRSSVPFDDDEDVAGLPPEDRDLSIIVDEVRDSLIKWKAECPRDLTEAIGEIVQGCTAEPYDLVRSLMISQISDFDRIPKAWIIDEIMKFDDSEVTYYIIHRHGQEDEVISARKLSR